MAALVGVIAGAALVGELYVRARAQGAVEGVPFVRTLAGSTDPLDVMLSWGDGQAFDAVARDPTLSHPEVFTDGASELAYRAQRPLVPYLAYAIALGRDAWIGWVIVGLVVLGAGVAAGATAYLARGSPLWAGPAVLLVPGVLAALNGLEVDPLAYGIAAIGVGLRRARPQSTWTVAIVFAAAALTRETTIVIPAGLVAYELVIERRTIRSLWLLVVPSVAFLGWAQIVRKIIGVGAEDLSGGRLSPPLQGLIEVAPGWGVDDYLMVALTVAVAALACARAPRHPFTWIALLHVPLALVFVADSWRHWEGFTRPLIPMYAFAMLVVVDGRVHVPRRSGQARRGRPSSGADARQER